MESKSPVDFQDFNLYLDYVRRNAYQMTTTAGGSLPLAAPSLPPPLQQRQHSRNEAAVMAAISANQETSPNHHQQQVISRRDGFPELPTNSSKKQFDEVCDVLKKYFPYFLSQFLFAGTLLHSTSILGFWSALTIWTGFLTTLCVSIAGHRQYRVWLGVSLFTLTVSCCALLVYVVGGCWDTYSWLYFVLLFQMSATAAYNGVELRKQESRAVRNGSVLPLYHSESLWSGVVKIVTGIAGCALQAIHNVSGVLIQMLESSRTITNMQDSSHAQGI